jgi:hypothetical protein
MAILEDIALPLHHQIILKVINPFPAVCQAIILLKVRIYSE